MKRVSLEEFQPRQWTPLPKTRQCCPTQNTTTSPHAESCTLRASWGLRKAPAYTLVGEPKRLPEQHDNETCNKASSGECLCRYHNARLCTQAGCKNVLGDGELLFCLRCRYQQELAALPRAGSLPRAVHEEPHTDYAIQRIVLQKNGHVKFCGCDGRAAHDYGVLICIHDPDHAGPHVDRTGFEWMD